MRTLAERIRSSRLKSGLSQMELAKQTQLTQQMISKLESGASRSTSAILPIAKALKVSADWLWQGGECAALYPLCNNDKVVHKAWLELTDKQRMEVCEYILTFSKSEISEQEEHL